MADQQNNNNPFAIEKANRPPTEYQSATIASATTREMSEVQASMAIAKRFPRDNIDAMDRILAACRRPTLADAAIYAYPRGDTLVTGPSIRLAEALSQNWGNMQSGIRELSQGDGESVVEAYAWDIETNTRASKVFQVKHERHTKRGKYKLTDPRDIYELVANQGARRLRACILSVIPGDVVEAAVKECEATTKNAMGAPAEQLKKLVAAFGRFGVTKAQLEKRLGHRLESTVAAEVLNLKRIYTSLNDGMASAVDYFPPEATDTDVRQAAKDAVKQRAAAAQTQATPTHEPEPQEEVEAAEDAADDTDEYQRELAAAEQEIF